MVSFKVEGSVAFVTGTNKPNGIGRAIVEALLESGASKVYATARKTSELDELVNKYNGKVVAVALDVTDIDAIAALPKSCPDVTLVVNNAGYGAYMSSLGDIEKAKIEMSINYIAPCRYITESTNR
jgi:NAD(P)-dependent dehydrogenase (short-subunit alcohol dehydrogenase family)